MVDTALFILYGASHFIMVTLSHHIFITCHGKSAHPAFSQLLEVCMPENGLEENFNNHILDTI